MKKAFITYLTLILIQSVVYSQNTGFTISDNGDFFQNGKKIGKVVKTTNSNLLTGTIPEFTVYDVNGVARFLFEKEQGKFIFLDDNKSFLPRIVDAYVKQIAQFFASDSILTARGYNVAYRSAFIKKHRGYDFLEKKERDYNAPIKYIENNILQGDVLIGRYEYRLMENGKDALVTVYDLNNKKVTFVTTTKDNSVTYFYMRILDANQKEVKVFEKEFDTGQLYKKGIEWAVQNGYLGSKPSESKPSLKIELPRRFLVVKELEQSEEKPHSTVVGISVDRSLTKMSMTLNENYLIPHDKSSSGESEIHYNVKSRIIDLPAGKITESIDSSLVRFVNGYTLTTDYSSASRKFFKLEELNGRTCISSGLSGITNCFEKPPAGIAYGNPLSDNTIIGFRINSSEPESFIYQTIGGETTVKNTLNVLLPKLSYDGEKIYGAYSYRPKLGRELDSLDALKFNESEPTDKQSKEYKSYKKRLEQFESSKQRRDKIRLSWENLNAPYLYWGIKVYDAKTGQLKLEAKLSETFQPRYKASNLSVEMLFDGKFLVRYNDFISSNGKAYLYDSNCSKQLLEIAGVDNTIPYPMFISTKTNSFFSISKNCIIKTFDLNSGAMIANVDDSAPGKNLSRGAMPFYIPINEGYVLVPYDNGLVSLFSFKEMKVVAELFVTIDDWAILARDGRFDGSLKALDKLEWREYIGDKISSKTDVASTFDGYYTPRLFNQLLTGEIGKVLAPVLSKQTAESLPSLTINTIDNQPPSKSAEGIVSLTTSRKNIALELNSSHNSQKIKEVRLYNNGKLVGVQKGSGATSYKFNVTLNSVMGETNAIYAVATTEMGVDSEKAKVIVKYTGSDSQPPKMYALIIGINEYQNPKYKLNYAYSDAESFQMQTSKLRSKLFNDVEVLMLSDKQASKVNIIEAFKSIGAKMKEQDVFLFYFAGHGTLGNIEGREEFFIVPYDVTQLYGNDAVLNEKAISAAELKIFSSQLNAQKQVFILDACNSAGALNAAATRGVAEEKAVAQLARSTGSYWLTAAGSEQYATEFEQLGHGVFTYSLLEAISGKSLSLTTDGVLTIRELSSFVEQRVPELSQQYKGKPQYPASFSIGNDFPLLVFTKEK